ncbi:MAG: adenylyl-sulfate reductase subunit alpha [Bacillota bacterium]|nr:adenylyl-sulfate reductase subunit alpha [Bacillota bacterium]
MKQTSLTTDLLIIGGGTAGCYAAITAARQDPELRILVAEKAHVKRSGCLAAGVNAINAYITPGQTPRDYLEFVRWDAEGILRDDLVLSMAQEFNQAAEDLERMGLVIQKDEEGNYVSRGKQNIKINGENLKPILAGALTQFPNVTVLNHVNITDYLTDGDRVCGAVGFSVEEEIAYVIAAQGVLCATGGASGLYRPNNPGFSRHKMWYPPFNTGAGYAMGIRAGAEMTSFEMRFVAQRCKDTIAPTGTIALGVGAREVNGLGEVYETKYGLSTSGRAFGTTNEAREGRGPCYLRTEGCTPQQDQELLRAYLNMAPSQTLKWLESGRLPSQQNVEVEGTEPYIVGGHTGSGYWVDSRRRTTLRGLYAAGDVAGGAPKKFVTGALAEGKIAALAFLEDRKDLPPLSEQALLLASRPVLSDYARCLSPGGAVGYDVFQLEEAMQKTMDDYAGGIRTGYRYNARQLTLAEEAIRELSRLARDLKAEDMDDLVHIFQLREQLVVCQSLIAHLLDRKETRWPGFGVNTDYPEKDETCAYYVNSRLVEGRIQVFHRPLVKGVFSYEHTH